MAYGRLPFVMSHNSILKCQGGISRAAGKVYLLELLVHICICICAYIEPLITHRHMIRIVMHSK